MGSIAKRNTFSVDDTVEIITRIKNGDRQPDICREFCLSKSTVGAIWKNRSLLISACEKNLNSDKKLRYGSGTTSKNEEKEDPIPLEPTVVIKEEPVDYDPTPSTSSHAAKEEFILPHEENTWSTPPMEVSPNPVETTQFISSVAPVSIAPVPVFTLSVSSLAPSNVPQASDSEPLQKKRKVKAKASATFTPTSALVPATLSATTNSVVMRPPSPVYTCGELSNSGALVESRKDQFDIFGEYVAAKLRSLDRRSCAFTQKAIGDIIFEAEMGKYLNGESNCDS